MEEYSNPNKINEENKVKKILIMGKPGVGKTSIKSVIFEKRAPKDTFKLSPTNEIEETHLNLLNNTPISILDCCSKEEETKKYFTTKKQLIFSKVEILVFVVELQNKSKRESDDEVAYFQK